MVTVVVAAVASGFRRATVLQGRREHAAAWRLTACRGGRRQAGQGRQQQAQAAAAAVSSLTANMGHAIKILTDFYDRECIWKTIEEFFLKKIRMKKRDALQLSLFS